MGSVAEWRQGDSIGFESDRERDLELRALGYDVVRLSYRQVVDSPGRVAAMLRQQLAEEKERAMR